MNRGVGTLLRVVAQATLFALLFSCSGCAYSLWKDNPLECCNGPAKNTHLQLFKSESGTDLLVSYDEYSERHDKVRHREYYVLPNRDRLAKDQKPKFADGDESSHLTPIPIVTSLTNAPKSPGENIYAVSTDSQSFVLYNGPTPLGHYDLPIYDDGIGKPERIALTPFAAAVDVSIVGGVVYGIYRGVATGTLNESVLPSGTP